MSIRLNKVTRNLNVGLSTVVGFLQKKGFPTEEDPNAKISDEEYELLVKEFSTDKNLKIESEKISQDRLFKEKRESVAVEGYEKKEEKKIEEIKTEIPEEYKPKFTTKGKIDLDAVNHKKKTETPVQEEESPQEEVVEVVEILVSQPEVVEEETAMPDFEESE